MTGTGKRRRPSPTIMVALVALFVALGGTGYATSQLGKRPAVSVARHARRGRHGDTRRDGLGELSGLARWGGVAPDVQASMQSTLRPDCKLAAAQRATVWATIRPPGGCLYSTRNDCSCVGVRGAVYGIASRAGFIAEAGEEAQRAVEQTVACFFR